MIPDTQYVALGCSGAFSNMMTWIVNNQAADQGGVFTTNIKAVIRGLYPPHQFGGIRPWRDSLRHT